MHFFLVIFFFQAEDGIRDVAVTGVQTCALPISGDKHVIEREREREERERERGERERERGERRREGDRKSVV